MRFLAKVWAIIGMPVGFVSISVLGFMLRSPPPVGANLNPEYLYFAVSVALLVRGNKRLLFAVPCCANS
jgi:hypothetical protein